MQENTIPRSRVISLAQLIESLNANGRFFECQADSDRSNSRETLEKYINRIRFVGGARESQQRQSCKENEGENDQAEKRGATHEQRLARW